MGIEVEARDSRGDWAAKNIKKHAREGFYGHIKIFFENGFITHSETTAREKAPVDMMKPRG